MSWVSKKLKYIELNGPSDKELKDIEADYALQESVNDLMLDNLHCAVTSVPVNNKQRAEISNIRMKARRT